MSKANYFYCLVSSNPDDKDCNKDMFGRKACSECIRKGDCRICGRQETELCNRCVNRKDGVENGLE